MRSILRAYTIIRGMVSVGVSKIHPQLKVLATLPVQTIYDCANNAGESVVDGHISNSVKMCPTSLLSLNKPEHVRGKKCTLVTQSASCCTALEYALLIPHA